MIYYLYVSVFMSFLIGFWYDRSLEDELARNKNLSDIEKLCIDGLIMKRAKPQFFLRKNMFRRDCWNINSRVRRCLVVHFFTVIHIYAVTILYFTVFD